MKDQVIKEINAYCDIVGESETVRARALGHADRMTTAELCSMTITEAADMCLHLAR